MTIYKTFVRPHLGYGDVIYDEAYNELLRENLNPFNIMPAFQELLEDRKEKNFTKN